MPVNYKFPEMGLSSRDVYRKSFLTRFYWNRKDDLLLSLIGLNDKNIIDLGCGEGITLEKLLKTFPDKKNHGYRLFIR